MAVGSPDDLGDEPWEFIDGHVLGESVVVDPVRAFTGVLEDGRIFRVDALPATRETGALRTEVETILAREKATRSVGPAVLIVASLL